MDLGKGPVYHLLLRAWCGLFGASEAFVRLPSVLAGAAAGTVPTCLAGPESTPRSRRVSRLSVPALVALGVSNHLSSVFFAASLRAGVLPAARRLGKPLRPVLAGGFVAGLLLLAQVSARHAVAGRIALSLRDPSRPAARCAARGTVTVDRASVTPDGKVLLSWPEGGAAPSDRAPAHAGR